MPRPVSVAITGGIGAGKSEALKSFAEHGAAVVSSDEIVHRLLQEDDEVRAALRERWGDQVFENTGDVDRAAVALAAGAWLFDLLAGASAGRTRLRADELAEGAPGDPLQATGAATGAAGDRARPGRGPAAAARAARDGDRKRNLALGSARSFDQLDLDLNSEVGPARA